MRPWRPVTQAGVVVAAMMSMVVLTGCEGAVVHPGTAAAGPVAVKAEVQPVATSLPAPVPTCTNAPAGWSRRESRQPGVSDVPRHQSPGLGSVVGYLDSFSAVCGQTLSVHLSTNSGPARVRLRALRIGDYRGRGARLVWQSPVLTAHQQQEAAPTGPDRVIAERWPVSAVITVDASWPPGMYLIEIAPLGAGQPSFIPLAVRTSGVRSPYIVVLSDLTWLAYNDYGGRSLYFGPGLNHTQRVDNRSYVGSADR
ncbi:MAG: N,N-dimethylformamidase beta subunit family domain-containing protein, partial [Actinomycetota bacterium]